MSSQWDDLPQPEPPPIIRPPVSLNVPPVRGGPISLDLGKESPDYLPRRRGVPRWLSTVVFCAISAALVAALMLGLKSKANTETLLEVLAVTPQKIREHDTLRLTIPLKYSGYEHGDITFGMSDAPEGATIDEKRGVITWKPSEEQGPGTYHITLKAFGSGAEDRMAKGRATIEVLEVNDPPQVAPIPERTVRAGQTLSFRVDARDPNNKPRPLRYELAADDASAASLDPETGQFVFKPGDDADPMYRFEVRVHQTGDAPKSASQRFVVHVEETRIAPVIPAAMAPVSREPLPPKPPAQPKPAEIPEAKPKDDSGADAMPSTPAFREPPPAGKKAKKGKK